MKIHIIGGPGSGKTFLAEKLSKELGISHFDLDDLQWDNKSASYGVKRSPDERDRLLNNVLSHNDWIIEGVYYAWCQQCFADADRIYLLNVPGYRYRSPRRHRRWPHRSCARTVPMCLPQPRMQDVCPPSSPTIAMSPYPATSHH